MQEKSKAEIWRKVCVNVSICLLASHPILNVIFTFTPLGMISKMYEDTKLHHVVANLKQFRFSLLIVPFKEFFFVGCSTSRGL